MAMKMGKHVYCQKPLTHSVYEARLMRETAQRQKVATQMGNQGTASDLLRRAVEIIQAGVIGPVHEVHVWTNRPIWPQGVEAILKVPAARSAALAALKGATSQDSKAIWKDSAARSAALAALHGNNGGSVPSHVPWGLFLRPAPKRPHDPIYPPLFLRGWWGFWSRPPGGIGRHPAHN